MPSSGAAISGPVAGGARGYAFSTPGDDVAGADFVVEEFFFEGTATAYDTEPGTEQGIDGRWSIRATRTAPFRTRMLVVRPAPEGFNGTVVVDWNNVTSGFEIATISADLLAEGCAWVGVSAQRVGLVGLPGTEKFALKQWDPERYGTLEHPGDDFSFDIYTQAARLVGPDRERDPLDPLGGLPAVRLLARGGSQSAMRLRTYINAVQPVEHVFDGFFNLVDFGWAHPVDTTNTPPREGGAAGIPMTISARIRDDLDVPVFVFNTETEAPSHFPVRQADTDRYRLWEIAGTAHAGGIETMVNLMTQLARDGVAFASAGTGGSGLSLDALQHPNVLSYAPAHKAATVHMLRWLTDGQPPPAQPWLEMVAGTPPTIRRDALGNARGGIRLPDLAVPVAVHSGVREGDLLVGLLGTSTPFSADELAHLYASRDVYLKAYAEAVDTAVAAGVVVAGDADAMKARAVATAPALPA
ncbi:MAG: alpha/beta hydrolase domain-containing protein [Acidimicrobiia bacterium]